MSHNNDNKTDFDDRLNRRFGSDTGNAGESDQINQSNSEQTSEKSQNAKKEWNVRGFYLDDDLDRNLTTASKRLDLEFSEADVDIELQKTRHFYLLLIMLRLEQLEEIDVTEITERLETRDR